MRQGGSNQGGSGRMRVPPQVKFSSTQISSIFRLTMEYLQFYRQNQNKMMQQQQNGQQRGNKSQNTLKFENEFDFEQANSKFEELRTQLAKLKVGPEENKQTPEQQVNRRFIIFVFDLAFINIIFFGSLCKHTSSFVSMSKFFGKLPP
jgi:hypothetical protein